MVIVELYHTRWNPQSNTALVGVRSIPKLVYNNTFLVLSIILGQGLPPPKNGNICANNSLSFLDLDLFFPRRLRPFFRLSVGLYCLVAVVICNAYTGTLTSFMTVPKLKPIVQSLEELAESDVYKLTAESNTPVTNLMMVYNAHFKILQQEIINRHY